MPVCNADGVEFDFVQDFAAAPRDVVDTFVDPDFWGALDGLSATSVPEVLDIRRHGDLVTVELRYRLIVALPREAARFIDTSNVSWVEVSDWNLRTATSQTRFVPDQAGRLLVASAVTSLTPFGDGTRRSISGDLRVRIPLLGSKVERAIIGGVGDHLEEQVPAVDRFVNASMG